MFDPFDEKNRYKRIRRKSSEVAFEKNQWKERVLNHFRRAIAELKNPEAVETETLRFVIENCPETNLDFITLRRTFEKSMNELGYAKVLNPGSKDGRFKIGHSFVFVYCLKNHRFCRKFSAEDKVKLIQLLTT